MRRGSVRWPRLELGFGFPLGFATGIATTIIAVAEGATHDPTLGMITLATSVGIVSTLTTLPGAVATAITCWALYAGFILGRAGTLALNVPSAQAAVQLLLLAILATGVGATITAWTTRPAITATGMRTITSPRRR